MVAVGTAVAGGPPRRSRRAHLTHRAPALGFGVEACVWPGMHGAGWREPLVGEATHPFPGHAGSLAAAPERTQPVSCDLFSEELERLLVVWHGVVGEVSSQHTLEPFALFGDG